ncbi:Ig-like domain-containing protein [Fimbriiglobus ruber]|uniref:SbsA Ig-like domain-containing protein n=1 Tax=Fimbriiglobus ruber TaxID=1908690 RepID=A0A225D3G1_9BACT|nr:hypothetical protein [Fimbriiglobus ruber]OWK36130.1 hypothetical protein FRUB_08693 [Fimbriiglobus ruber]
MIPYRSALILLGAIALAAGAAEPAKIRLSTDGKAIELPGVDAAVAPRVSVVVAVGSDKETAARPPIPGSTRVVDGVVRFEPRFPLTPGVTYRVTAGDVSSDVIVPKVKREPTTTIAAVYPTGDRLPENTLRLYIHFSAPMTRGDVYQHIKLHTADGKQVVQPFLELDEELWSADGKRFTLLFDPGRIKRGLKPREDLGPALEEGKSYTLTIDRAWEDENGVPLKVGFQKSFSVGPPDDEPIDPEKWRITPPAAGGVASLAVAFEKPLDHALLHRMVWVVGPGGKKLAGEIVVAGDQKAWSFRPRAAWVAGEYQLMTDTRLEDRCGNRVGEPFEIDVFKPVQKKIEGKTVSKAFEVK